MSTPSASARTQQATPTSRHEPAQAPSQRLPCRGCLPTCSNYTHCNGKPWRQGV